MPQLSETERIFIEDVAQQRVKFNRIFNEQAAIFRNNLPEYEAALAQFQQQSSRLWQPRPEKVDEYINDCKKLCQQTPQNLYDRVEIMHAAHAAMLCLILCKMDACKESVTDAIETRMEELNVQLEGRIPESKLSSRFPIAHPSSMSRPMTADELARFQNNPDMLHGKRFILSPDTEDFKSEIYEVISYSKKRDGSIVYELLFDDLLEDPMEVDAEEMRNMLRDSLYVPACTTP